MSRNVDGEFELVLGNKQLLSMFFLVVVLFGVFFSLGYMVGKSVMPAAGMAAQSGPPSVSEPPQRPSPAEAKDPAPPAAQPEPEPEPPRSEPAAPVAEPPVAASAPAAPLIARDLHLQIAAVRVREDAEALVSSLRKKGYDPTLNTQMRDGWYRVLVGPFPSERAAQEMKARLEKDGYKSILRKP